MTGYKYKTIKARNVTELTRKVKQCETKEWNTDGQVEIHETTVDNGVKVKMLYQGMIKYPRVLV